MQVKHPPHFTCYLSPICLFRWANARYLLRFLADLVNCYVVSAGSVLQLLDNFVDAALEEGVPQVTFPDLKDGASNLYPLQQRTPSVPGMLSHTTVALFILSDMIKLPFSVFLSSAAARLVCLLCPLGLTLGGS